MIEIRFHGRAGQGIVTASETLALAVSMEGRHSQAFPVFGSEKRGPPVTAFCRIDSKPIRIYEEITEPDYVVVIDDSILKSVDVCMGLKQSGLVLVNSKKKPNELSLSAKRVFTVDGTNIAIKNLGKPIANTVMLGAFIKLTGIAKLDSVLKALSQKFDGKLSREVIDANLKTVKECFDKMEGLKVAHSTV